MSNPQGTIVWDDEPQAGGQIQWDTDGGDTWDEPRNPLKEALKNTGDILGGGFKRAVQAGPASFNTITGGPATEFAHGVKMEALKKTPIPEYPIGEVGIGGGNLHEAIASATDPQNLLGADAFSRMGEAEYLNPGAVERLKAMKVSAKGRQTVSRLLPSAKISEDIQAGRPSGVQVEGFNLIKKTKNPIDIVNKFRNERQRVVNDVDSYVEQNNKPVSPRSIRERAENILSEQLANSSDDDIKNLRESIDEELNHMPTDTKSANARKRFLYKKTQSLQKAQRLGKTIVSKPGEALVEDAFAKAYKEAIEDAHPDIAPTNARFEGLDAGVKASSNLVEGETEQTPMGERVFSNTVGRPSKPGMLAALIRELPIIGSSPRRLSSLIEKLNIKHGDLILKARQKQAPFLLNREFFSPEAAPEQAPHVPYKLQYAGGAGSYSAPDVAPEQAPMNPLQYKRGSRVGPVEQGEPYSDEPYGKDLPYKKTSLKDLAKKSKKK